MKYFNQFTGFSALLLAGTMGFAACSSDDEVADVNPSYDGSSVKTQFSIAVTQKANKGSRMTDNQAQEDGVFDGMQNIKLYPFALGSSTLSSATNIVQEPSDLADFVAFNYQNSGRSLNGKIYNNQSFNMGTDHFLFYAESKGSTEGRIKATHGSAGNDVSTLNFDLKTIKEEKFSDDTEYNKKRDATLAALNNVIRVLKASATNDPSVKVLLENFEGLNGSDYYDLAGSSESVRAWVEITYKSLKGMSGTAYHTLADNILKNESGNIFTYDSDKLQWVNDPKWPTNYGLPAGAVAVRYNPAVGFEVKNANIGGAQAAPVEKYTFPASLYYRADCDAKTKNTTYFNLPDESTKTNATEANWGAVAGNFTDGKTITPSTRSVILEKQVQYAVADLRTSIRFNNGDIKDKKNYEVTVGTNTFEVTGVLVGNQNSVDYKFEKTGSEAYTIYDPVFKSSDPTYVTKTGYTDENHTLVLESPSTGTTDVVIAVEMKNNGAPFYGVNNCIIPTGTKFYLIATLQVANDAQPEGTTSNLDRIFKQDYFTTVKLTINSLANAYNVVPDLRAPQLEFGLSVDLNWQAGMNFEVNIGGDN
ncbi:MAG: hypothetical protein MR605_07135 [Bacteroidales bacterium]|nr:hypothetical protein [Bacteroidales bacterium]